MPYNFNYGGVINTGELQGVIDPTNPQDAATKKYVDAKSIYITDTDTELSGKTFTDSSDIRFTVNADSEVDLFIVNGSVTADKLADGSVITTKILDANVTLAKLNSDITISTLPLPVTDLNMNGNRVTALADPILDNQAATKGYVDTADTAITTAFTAADDAITTAYTAADTTITTNYKQADSDVRTSLTTALANEMTARVARDSELFELIHAGQPETTVYFDLRKGGVSPVQDGTFSNNQINLLVAGQYNFTTSITNNHATLLFNDSDIDTDELNEFTPGDFIRITQVDDTTNSATYSYLSYNNVAAVGVIPGDRATVIVFNPYPLRQETKAPFEAGISNSYAAGTEFKIEFGHSGTIQINTLDSDTSGIVRHAPTGQGDSTRYLGADGNWYLKDVFNDVNFNVTGNMVDVDTDVLATRSYVDTSISNIPIDQEGYGIDIVTTGGISTINVDTDVIADTDYVKQYVADHANVGHEDTEGFGIKVDTSNPLDTVFSVDTEVIVDKVALDSEILILTTADTALGTRIDSEVLVLNTRIDSEALALQANIDANVSEIVPWGNTTNYVVNEPVSHGGRIWRALAANVNIEPSIVSFSTWQDLTGVKLVTAGTGITIPSPGDNTVTVNVDTTTISTKAYVDTEIANLIGGAPATLDTLKELAEALSDDTDAFNTLFNRTRIDSDGSRGLKRDGTGTSTKLYVDTDVIADTEWVKARIAAEDHIDTKYTSGYGLNLVDSEFSVNTGKFLDTDALENYVKESFTEVGYIVVDGGLNIQLSRDLTGGSDRQELAYTAGNGLKLASDANRTLTVDTDIIADTEWVKARIAAEDHIDTKYTAGTGLNLVDSEFSVNTSVIATQTYVNTHAGVIKDTEVSSGTGITVLQVDSEGTSHTEINIDTETYFPVTNSSINTLFGRRIKTFNLSTGTIEFEEFAYVYSNVTDTYTPSSVRWDQPATQTRIRYNNNDNFQSEFVNTLANWSTFHSATPSNLTTLTIPAVNNTYVSTFDVSATFSGDNGKDQDVQSTWATNGQGGGIGTQYQLRTNNGSVSAGQTTALNWPNVSASNSWPGKTPIRFDSIQTTLPLRVSYNTATSANNINLTALRMTVGGIGTDLDTDANITKSTSQINTTASGVTIYYDTSVDITASVDFTRPETVMEGTLAQRTYGYSSTLPNQVAGARYPHWRILNSTNVGQVFDVTELGALSNSGYATSAVSTSTSKTSWRNSTYTASSGATGQTMHLVVPSAPVAGFRDPLNQSLTFTPNNGDAGTQVTLGHTDHTETYFVYSFNVPANASLTVQPF